MGDPRERNENLQFLGVDDPMLYCQSLRAMTTACSERLAIDYFPIGALTLVAWKLSCDRPGEAN